jgi:endonuclease III
VRSGGRAPSYGSVLGAMARHLAKRFPDSPPTALAAAAGAGAAQGLGVGQGGGAAGGRAADPFRVLVSTIISTRTKDEVTAAAADRLLAAAPDARRLAALAPARIARLIFPAGFYRTKAANLRESARLLLERHAGRVPSGMEDLLALPGVGRKVANLVRGLAFGIDGICVDTHVHRISNRLGWVATRDPAGTERALLRVLPRRYWIVVNEIMVRWGQSVCTPLSPRCSECSVAGSCRRRGVTRSR